MSSLRGRLPLTQIAVPLCCTHACSFACDRSTGPTVHTAAQALHAQRKCSTGVVVQPLLALIF